MKLAIGKQEDLVGPISLTETFSSFCTIILWNMSMLNQLPSSSFCVFYKLHPLEKTWWMFREVQSRNISEKSFWNPAGSAVSDMKGLIFFLYCRHGNKLCTNIHAKFYQFAASGLLEKLRTVSESNTSSRAYGSGDLKNLRLQHSLILMGWVET